jgi:hypothetical protein
MKRMKAFNPARNLSFRGWIEARRAPDGQKHSIHSRKVAVAVGLKPNPRAR